MKTHNADYARLWLRNKKFIFHSSKTIQEKASELEQVSWFCEGFVTMCYSRAHKFSENYADQTEADKNQFDQSSFTSLQFIECLGGGTW